MDLFVASNTGHIHCWKTSKVFLFGWFCLFLILLNFCKFDTVRVCYTTLGFAQVHKNVETRSVGKIFPCYTSAFIKDNISQDLSSLGDCVCGDLL